MRFPKENLFVMGIQEICIERHSPLMSEKMPRVLLQVKYIETYKLKLVLRSSGHFVMKHITLFKVLLIYRTMVIRKASENCEKNRK